MNCREAVADPFSVCASFVYTCRCVSGIESDVTPGLFHTSTRVSRREIYMYSKSPPHKENDLTHLTPRARTERSDTDTQHAQDCWTGDRSGS